MPMLLCPNLRCRKMLSVPEEVRGKTVICRHCQTIVRVPQKPPATATAGAGVKK